MVSQSGPTETLTHPCPTPHIYAHTYTHMHRIPGDAHGSLLEKLALFLRASKNKVIRWPDARDDSCVWLRSSRWTCIGEWIPDHPLIRRHGHPQQRHRKSYDVIQQGGLAFGEHERGGRHCDSHQRKGGELEKGQDHLGHGEVLETTPFHKTRKLSHSWPSWGLYCRGIKVACVYRRFGALSACNCAVLGPWVLPS